MTTNRGTVVAGNGHTYELVTIFKCEACGLEEHWPTKIGSAEDEEVKEGEVFNARQTRDFEKGREHKCEQSAANLERCIEQVRAARVGV